MGKNDNKYAAVPVSEGGYFGLGRPIDFSDGLTRIALICTILTVVASMLWKSMSGMESMESVYFAMNTGMAFFFSWLIAQELDPDRKLGGLIGGGLSIVAALSLGAGNILTLLWLLFVLRLLNRTSGSRHKIGDNILILLIAYWLGKDGYWLYPVLTGTVYVAESQIKGGYFRSLYLAGLAFALAATSTLTYEVYNLSVIYLYIMALTFILFLPEIRLATYVQSKGDMDNKRLSPQRVQAAQAAFLIIGFILPWFHGNSEALSLMPAWMAGCGTGMYLLATAIYKSMEKK